MPPSHASPPQPRQEPGSGGRREGGIERTGWDRGWGLGCWEGGGAMMSEGRGCRPSCVMKCRGVGLWMQMTQS